MNKIPHPPHGGMLWKDGVLLSREESVRLLESAPDTRAEIIAEYVQYLHDNEDHPDEEPREH